MASSGSAGKKTKGGAKDDILQQQDVLQAVVIAENFNRKFAPLTAEKPSALFPLVNKYLLDYSLEALQKCGVQEVFVFCSAHSQQIRTHVCEKWTNKGNSSMTVTVISSDSFMSVGDAIRELDSKALIRSDFILINGHVVTTLPLAKIMDEHKKCRKADKGCAMTLIYREVYPQHRARCAEDDTLLAVESNTKKIRFYQKVKNKKTLNIPLEVFQENDNVTVHYNILDCHICICSPCVPPLYADNFDYQTFEDLVRGLIINEEVLGNSMYLHLASCGYGSSVSNLFMYDAVSQDIVQRWSYPVVPDLFLQNGARYNYLRGNIYRDANTDLHRNCRLQQNVVLGKGTTVGENVEIENTVIGCNCFIGSNVIIKGSYLWDNVVIGDNCELEKCLLGDSVVLKTNVKVGPGCILSSKVIIGDYVSLPPLTKLQFESPDDDDEFGDDSDKEQAFPDISECVAACDPQYVGVNGRGFLYSEETFGCDDDDDNGVIDAWGISPKANISVEDEEDDDDRASTNASDAFSEHSDANESPAAEEEDTTLFYNEVFECLQRAVEEKISCENLILEINSAKYAWNVTIKEVNCLVTKAILHVAYQKGAKSAQEYFNQLKPVLQNFLLLLNNYIKNAASQLDCLQTIEDFMISNENLSPIFMKILHILYNKEILSEHVILKWYENPSKGAEKIRQQISPFVRWLKEADEESSED